MEKWIINLKNTYCKLRKENEKLVWLNNRNFFLRLFERDNTYQEVIDSDIKFASNINEIISKEIIKNELHIKNIRDSILFLKIHISKNEERIKFLISFPILFTFVIIFQKLKLLEIILPNPFNIILIIVLSILTILALAERTKLTSYKHCLEELVLLLDNFLKDMSNKT